MSAQGPSTSAMQSVGFSTQGSFPSTDVQDAGISDDQSEILALLELAHARSILTDAFASPIPLELVKIPTKGMSRENVMGASRVLREIFKDVKDIRQDTYQLNDKLNADVLKIEQAIQMLMQ